MSLPTAADLERDGFALWRGLLDPATVDAFEPVIRRVARESPQHGVAMASRSTYQRAFVQEMNLWQRSADVRGLVFDERIARAAAALLGVGGVRMYHDQALVKEPFGGRTPWHCDQHYWPLDTDRTVTAWIPLVDVPIGMGPLRFCAGSHRLADGREMEISDRSDASFEQRLERGEFTPYETGFRRGDVSFHLGWTWHGAPPNTTDRWRTVMTVIFAADGIRLAEPTNPSQQNDRQAWLGDQRIGEQMGGPLHPLMWHADGSHRAELAALAEPEQSIGTIPLESLRNRNRLSPAVNHVRGTLRRWRAS